MNYINLQCVDHLTMAYPIKERVPFLDLKIIKLEQRISAHFKLRGKPPVKK